MGHFSLKEYQTPLTLLSILTLILIHPQAHMQKILVQELMQGSSLYLIHAQLLRT